MNKFHFVFLGVLLINLAGCNESEYDKEQLSKQEVKRNIMGDGNKPMPKLSDYEKK